MNFYKIFIVLLTLITVSNSVHAVNENNNPIAIDSRIKTFVYSDNEVYDVVFNYVITHI